MNAYETEAMGQLFEKRGYEIVPFGKEADTVGTIGAILVLIQMFPMIGTIIPTEKALKKNFDDYGRHR